MRPTSPNQAEAIPRGQVARAQPTVACQQFLTFVLILPIVRSETATAYLALARLTGFAQIGRFRPPPGCETAAIGKQRSPLPGKNESSMPIMAQAAQFHHAVAVQKHRRNPPAARQPDQRAELPQALPHFRGQMIAGREPDTHAC